LDLSLVFLFDEPILYLLRGEIFSLCDSVDLIPPFFMLTLGLCFLFLGLLGLKVLEDLVCSSLGSVILVLKLAEDVHTLLVFESLTHIQGCLSSLVAFENAN
jgi:hypothetical protein